MSVLGKLNPAQFLHKYWQKKPVVIRQAFPDLELPFSPEELAGLACDTEAPSRIVLEHGTTPWESRHGPFTDEDFTSLPETHWTLLVNDIERYVPELGNFIEPFRFIPDWRIDDVMVSYAADQGSVGPHSDEYDVFLIQAMGKRRWQVITGDDYPKATIPDISLSILSEFEADQEWLLEAGDMLYLPPNVPHYGIAEDPCMTFSVGFRAPSQQELLQSWIESFCSDAEFKQRFSDAGRKLQTSSAEISQQDIRTLSTLIVDGIQSKQGGLSQWLGKYLTETRGEVVEQDGNQASINKHKPYQARLDYERKSWLRFAYIESGDTIEFFADGRHVSLALELKESIQQLCSDYYYTAGSLSALMANRHFSTLFNQLIAENAIYPAE